MAIQKANEHVFKTYSCSFSLHHNTKWLALGPLNMRSNLQSDACHFIIITAWHNVIVFYLFSMHTKFDLRYVPFVLSSETCMSLTMNRKSIKLRRRSAALGPRRNYPVNAEMWAFMTSSLTHHPGNVFKMIWIYLKLKHSTILVFLLRCVDGLTLPCMVSGIEWGGERSCGRGNYVRGCAVVLCI